MLLSLVSLAVSSFAISLDFPYASVYEQTFFKCGQKFKCIIACTCIHFGKKLSQGLFCVVLSFFLSECLN